MMLLNGELQVIQSKCWRLQIVTDNIVASLFNLENYAGNLFHFPLEQETIRKSVNVSFCFFAGKKMQGKSQSCEGQGSRYEM